MEDKKELKDKQLDKAVGGINIFDPSDIQIIENPTPKYKVGDKVKYKNLTYYIIKVKPQQFSVTYDISSQRPNSHMPKCGVERYDIIEQLLEN